MIHPDFEGFKRLSTQGNLIPVFKEILGDTETPVSAFLKLSSPPSFLLESVEGGEKWARFSFIGINPSKIIKGTGSKVEITDNSGLVENIQTDDPLEVLKSELGRYEQVHIPDLPRFCGGFIGYLGYDTVRFFEKIPDNGKDGIHMPDLFFMLADTLLVFDSLKQKIKVITNAFIDSSNLEDSYHQAVQKIDDIIQRLRTQNINTQFKVLGRKTPEEFVSSFNDKKDFLEAVEKSKKYVVSGDVVQVVVSQRFGRKCAADPFSIYRSLRVINPSPYMYYIDTGREKIIGSSPEILVRVEDEKIGLRPIAGTRRRGRTEQEDIALETELRNDPKEKAEHIMLVDLGRNDVGRVAKVGTVQVTELMTVERYSHVMHLVSNVIGELEDNRDIFDVIRACFPAGTVTGAPKIRAMEIIEELEPVKRGAYAGSIGYFSFSKNMDMCITIRTLIFKDSMIYVQAGAGIVADSNPQMEYLETVNKAMGMMKSVEMAEEALD